MDGGFIMNNSNVIPANVINSRLFAVPSGNESINSTDLFKNGDVIFIQHQGEQYRLRRTRNGKLILTK